MATKDSTKFPNNNNNNNQNQNHHPYPFIQYHPSSEHGRTYSFNVSPISSQNTFIAPNNTTLVQIPPSSFSSRNLLGGQSSSLFTQPSWMNYSAGIEDFHHQSSMGGLCLFPDPGIEDIESSFRGLLLSSDPDTRNSSSTDLFIDSLLFNGCDYDISSFEALLMMNSIRAQSAASSYSSRYPSIAPLAGVGGNSNRVLAPLGRGGGGGGYNNNGFMLGRPIKKPKSSVVISMARDQCGCRLLQAKIDEGTPEEVQAILSQVKDHTLYLMTHPFGNYLIQKIFVAETVNDNQIGMMLSSILKDEQKLKQVCFNDHGTRAVQQILKKLRTDWQIALVASVMRRITVPLMKNINASYVIAELLQTFPIPFKISIFEEMANNCVSIATDKSGCSSIQRCMEIAPYDVLTVLFDAIILNAPVLSQDQYGNYVVQYVIKQGIQPIISMIVSHLVGKYTKLCLDKYGSHVVEDLFRYAEKWDLTIITEEIMHNSDFFKVLQDQYGNFVIQKALQFTKGDLQKRLVRGILSNSGNLASDIHGKRVLAGARGIRIHAYE